METRDNQTPKPTQDEGHARDALAKLIARRSDEIVERWIDEVRADATAARVPLTDLRDGIHDYLTRLAELLADSDSVQSVGTSAWGDIAREHAITRVRLAFDVSQLFHELVVLRRIIIDVLHEDESVAAGDNVRRVTELVDVAIAASIKSYVDFRDYETRHAEAEHIGFLTHELRNPLAAAAMAASQLRTSGMSGELQARLFEILDRNIDRLRRMIDETLLTERLEAGEVESRPIDTTVEHLLRDQLEVWRSSARSKGLGLVISFDPRTHLRVDPNLTTSAIENLVDNAIKYTDAGQVTIDIKDLPNDVVFHVRDQCPGLSAAQLRVVFEPFRRTHPNKPGTGLGLAIAKRAIEAQGGTVHAESGGDGCHFWFRLPKSQH